MQNKNKVGEGGVNLLKSFCQCQFSMPILRLNPPPPPPSSDAYDRIKVQNSQEEVNRQSIDPP